MNKICFMFGHADCPDDILPQLEQIIEHYYLNIHIQEFYVGHRGRFDSLAATAVKRVKQRHSDIRLYLVLAYHPGKRKVALSDGFDGSYYPLLEKVPRRYAIVISNCHMIDAADALICYVSHVGNARDFLIYARQHRTRDGIPIENVAENV